MDSRIRYCVRPAACFVWDGSSSGLLVSDTTGPRALCLRDASQQRTSSFFSNSKLFRSFSECDICVKKTQTSCQASWCTLGILNPKNTRETVWSGVGRYRQPSRRMPSCTLWGGECVAWSVMANPKPPNPKPKNQNPKPRLWG